MPSPLGRLSRVWGLARPLWLRLDGYRLGANDATSGIVTFLGVANYRADGIRQRRIRDKLFHDRRFHGVVQIMSRKFERRKSFALL
jgi:hypothetical protein